MERPGTGLYVFPSDLLDEGVDAVRRRSDELGAGTLVVAVAYHQARDVVPHAGRKPRLRYREDGVFFEPDPDRWTGTTLRPRVQPQDQRDALAALLATGAPVEAWTVFLHNTSLGEEHPRLASETCFGDRLLSNLCPSNPEAAGYADALAADIAARGLDIVAEALSGQTFAHGHHHERSFSPVSELDEAVLGICFCEHCTRAGTSAGLDVGRVAAAARVRVQSAFAGAAGRPATLEALAETLGGDVLAYLSTQQQTVTALADRLARTVRGHGRTLSYMDLTGAVLGYGDGAPSGPAAASQGWRIAVDLSSVAPLTDSCSVLGYTVDTTRLHADVASYRAAVGGSRLRVVLRPGWPDTSSRAHLRDKVRAVLDAGADQVDFYTYGMYDQEVLDRIPYAMDGLSVP
ncbi:hypothetical protein [Aquipuribacter hungaricus]|uniref:Alanine-rich protein n=1 Tax=Aquipuribacter hungaricus TaxID=545624 RepID=A0ABV7WDS2_9MICO